MLTKKYQCLILLPLIFFSFSVFAQRIDSLLTIMDTQFPQEKMHVHFDKSYYNPGETIWFKAYLAADNLPGGISKTVYADLVDEKGNLLQRKMIPVIQSGAASNFDLPDTMKATQLFFRAYTQWMLNFDSSLVYTKPIRFIPAKNTAKKTAVVPTFSIAFFPEGGNLVEKVKARVAFKAIDHQGVPFLVTGDIADSKGKKIISFAALHDGMGFFELTPQSGESYKAIWKDKKGGLHETALPAAIKEGVVLSVYMPDNDLFYTLKRPDTSSPQYTTYFVVAQMQQRVMYSARINMSKKTEVTAPILTDSFPNGVLQLTIFNAAEVPVAERVVYINHDNYSFITDVHTTDKNLAKRGKNGIQLDIGGSFTANLSISVTDAGLNPITPNEESIYSQLLLSSDLKGPVYNPAYYFTATDDSVKIKLDLVMMTNGWRRFKWEDILAAKWPAIQYIPENYLSVGGKILGLSKSLLFQKEITGILKTKNGATNFFSMPIDAQGVFQQKDLYFFDTAKLYYQLNNDKDKRLTTSASFSFTNNFLRAPIATNAYLSSLYLPQKEDSAVLVKGSTMAALQRDQVAFNKVKTLETVQLKSSVKSAKQKLDEEYTSGFFSGGDGYTFNTEDDPFAKSAISILAYLQGRVAGLQVSTTGDGSATWRGSPTSFFVNEINSDASQLQSISMNDVALIKVFRPPFFGGIGGGAGGAIAIYTKKGGSGNSQVQGLPVTTIYGYTPIKEFYSPDYEKNPEADLKDYRSTLYWNPYLFFDKNTRRLVLPFYNSDNCKKFRVTIEGINELGQLTREEQIIE